MKPVFYMVIITIIVSAFSLFAAKLVILEKAQQQIEQINKKNSSQPTDLSDSRILGKKETGGRPVVFEVIKAKKDDKLMQHFSRTVSLPENVVFNAIKGSYSYNNIVLQRVALKSINQQDLIKLKTRANTVLEQLLGNEVADHFVPANEETDYVKENDLDKERILRKTYRFTRTINGRHILDNTSFVRLSFSAGQELSAFEIVNPDLRPVRNVTRLIKSGAIENRLREYAANKKTADRNGPESIEKIGVTSITAENCFNTYLSKKEGEKMLLFPGISFYSDYQLENGEHFKNWSHFCLDADHVPNIDNDLIEGSKR
jgi:hypothetical protein